MVSNANGTKGGRGGFHTEVGLARVQNPLVEQDNTGTQSNPQTGDKLEKPINLDTATKPCDRDQRYARNVESRVKAIVLGRSGGSSTTLELTLILR